MIRSIVVALCCLAGLQNTTRPVVRLGEARNLRDTDWAAIREALGAARVPWVINVSTGSQVGPFRWHATAYLSASVVQDDLRRGSLVDLEATYEGSNRVWRDLRLGGGWAQVALAPDRLRDDFGESDRARPFVVRGDFTDAEIRAIVTAIRRWRPSGRDQRAAGLGALVGLGRSGPMAAEAQCEDHLFATLEIRDGAWIVVSTRIVIA